MTPPRRQVAWLPDRGEVIWINHNPQAGREMKDHHSQRSSSSRCWRSWGKSWASWPERARQAASRPRVAYGILYRPGGLAMDAISYTTAQANLAQTMKRVCADHEPLIITRNGEPSVVMVSLDDFKALEETAYLLRSPNNARRLMDAIDSLNTGGGQEHALAE